MKMDHEMQTGIRDAMATSENKAFMTAILEGFEQAKAKLNGVRLQMKSQSYAHAFYRWRSCRAISNSLKMLERATKERDIRNLDRAKKEYMVDIVLNWIKVS